MKIFCVRHWVAGHQFLMLSQTFCYWDKYQSADSIIIQFHLTLKCTQDQSSHFCDCFLVSKWIFQHHDRGLTKFHAGSEQPRVCDVINNSHYPIVKNSNTANHAFGKYWIQARGFLNYHLNIAGRKLYCVCQPNELKREKNGGANRKSTKNLGWGMAHPGPP